MTRRRLLSLLGSLPAFGKVSPPVRLHFGLGPELTADLEIRWPNGGVERIVKVACDQLVTVREGAGIVKAERFRAARPDAGLP